MQKDLLVEEVKTMVKPLVENLGYEFYHIEYVKESNEYYLRVYIDNEAGISLNDCEKVSRLISDLLDNKDPITDPYYLEVSSPGIFRQLFTDEHINRYMGHEVLVKLSKPVENKKSYKCILKSLTDEILTVEVDGNTLDIPRDKIKAVNLEGEI
ncbi:ribosome maturation factor RimP [Inconstantimicrobium mannanitabidum]|uniref:Ribosome maturation factor RimP n=1 Tax=Inconstantimicrobium mannanitabidum TaxID=1604901 RepID=A0ACB5RB74_9CLOT|nr:ribosome maturation factor RimP [Clostridium sp. TW13]GKX66306.1 ribosome maturation factor RimP [Clostridium sp. TW13]